MFEKFNRIKETYKKSLIKKRLIVLNEETFEETFSMRLNLMNVFVVCSIGSILLIATTTVLIAFTPLREYIPGYTSTKLKKDAMELAIKSDSLSVALSKNQAYIISIQKVLTGKLDHAKLSKDSIILQTNDKPISQESLNASKGEIELRAAVDEEKEKEKKLKKKK